MPRRRIHTRTITVDVFDEGDGTLSIEGRLQDSQPEDSGYFPYAQRKNDPRPPGVQHGMAARMRVDRATSDILKTDGQFPHTPHAGCETVLGSLSRLDGVRIGAGYSGKSRELLGGTRGCVHMNTLLQVMANTKGPASAYFIEGGREGALKRFREQLIETGKLGQTDTCHQWKSGGVEMTHIRAEIAALEAEGKI